MRKRVSSVLEEIRYELDTDHESNYGSYPEKSMHDKELPKDQSTSS